MAAPTIAWEAQEHAHTRTSDWFWMLGVLAVSIAIAAILWGNLLFGVLIIVGAVALGLSANKEARTVSYKITPRGIEVDGTLHPYTGLVAFWIDEEHSGERILLIDAQRMLVPHLVLPLPDEIDSDAVQDYLLDYLPEEELYESPAHRLFEILGF